MERRRRPRPDAEPMTKAVRRREKPRERWLLTRKTWKYMSDAGRRLVPDGAQNRAEDVPRLEAYFQDVCQRESRFLLWRKSSYPGAIPRPRRKKRPRGGSVRARSPSDEPPAPVRPTDLRVPHTSGGRFDIAKLRRDFFATPAGPAGVSAAPRLTGVPPKPPPPLDPEDEEESSLVDLLRKYLKLEDDSGPTRISESEELVRSLRRYLKRQADRTTDADGEHGPRTLLENLGRYYCRSPNRENIVQDLLTDRNLLKRLYHDLRKTKPYRGGRAGGGGGYGPSGYGGTGTRMLRRYGDSGADGTLSPPMSPPPLIEVFSESLEELARLSISTSACGTQTMPIPEEVLVELERAYRERNEAASPTSPASPPPERKPGRRRSSVDHDDVSQSVSDTIKRYLRMARKKSVDADKADRFKRINYDKNLRNIKPRAPGEVDDDGLSKGCQTEEQWILTYRDLQFASVASTPTSPMSPASPTQSHSFLSALLGRGGTVAPGAGGMQKSRSSSSVVQSVSKRLWRTRSRSSSRAAAAWTPQGSCLWADGTGRCVRLSDTSILTLSEVERRALQQAALARLQQISPSIGAVKIPDENAPAATTKPKRRAYLLKRKALTTGFFDQSRAKDSDKDKDTPAGSVFGVSLTQCVENERALRRQHGGSRASLASLGALERAEDSESCDSGDWGWSGVEDSGGPRVPALVSACINHLRHHGLDTVGLFRVSPSKKRVRQLREDWERGHEAAIDSAVCPHDVATLLKEFLRDLPDPLLCRDLYQAFLQTQKIRNRETQWNALKLLVQLLPAAHRDTLSALLAFLGELASRSEAECGGNKMDAANLATVFAPNILHRSRPDEVASAEQLAERTDVINVVRLLVERQASLWSLPADQLHAAYRHLASAAPAALDALLPRKAELVCLPGETASSASSDGAARRMLSREEFMHGAAATGGPTDVVQPRRSEKSYARSRRRDTASDTSSGSSAMTIVTGRVRNSEDCGPARSGGSGGSWSVARDSAADSNDSASDYNETLGGSDDDSCVITASLHIPAAFAREATRRPSAPPRRRSTSGSESSAKRDSAVGSSTPASPASASSASSPPASPPPTALRVTMTSAGEVKRPADIDRLISLGRERNTSDARAVVLRQHDDTTVRSRTSTRQEQTRIRGSEEKKEEPRRDGREGTTLYKRGELISSARSHPT